MDKLYPDWRDIVAVIALVLITIGIFVVLRWLTNYPDGKDWQFAMSVALGVGAIPILFRLLSFLQQTRSVLDIKGIKIDFGKSVAIPGVQLAENVVDKGVPVYDSGTQEVLNVARLAGASTVAIVDLKSADAWYKTRLFALAATALVSGYPRVIVFLATLNSSRSSFLGFADGPAIARAIMQDRDYKAAFENAVKRYYQAAVTDPTFEGPPTFMLLLIRETMHLETPPRSEPWLGPLDIEELLGDDLHKDAVEDRKKDHEAIFRFLSSRAEHVALTRGRRFLGLIPVSRVMREILLTLGGNSLAN